ncbi:amino acid ABC transporter permease [Agrobacterium burrii]
MKYTLDFSIVLASSDKLLYGAWLTFVITLISLVIGVIIAAFGAYQLTNGSRWTKWIWGAYIEIVRNTPLLAQLFLIFFGLPALGVKLSANVAAVVALSFNFAAYAAEIIRSGVDNVPRGQSEAGKALGLKTGQIFFRIILKPALATIYPALAAQCVLVLLGSAIISTISANDLSSIAAVIQSATFRPFEVYFVVTAIYLVMALVLQGALDVVGRIAFPFHNTREVR